MTSALRRLAVPAAAAMAVGLSGCASPDPAPGDAGRDCVVNFEETPGVSSYRTTVSLDGVSRADATERLDRELARMGFRVNESDPARGRIDATFDAGTSVIQVAAFIDSRSDGSMAELNIAGTGAGIGSLVTPAGAYRNDLCRFERAMRGET